MTTPVQHTTRRTIFEVAALASSIEAHALALAETEDTKELDKIIKELFEMRVHLEYLHYGMRAKR